MKCFIWHLENKMDIYFRMCRPRKGWENSIFVKRFSFLLTGISLQSKTLELRSCLDGCGLNTYPFLKWLTDQKCNNYPCRFLRRSQIDCLSTSSPCEGVHVATFDTIVEVAGETLYISLTMTLPLSPPYKYICKNIFHFIQHMM